MNVFVHDIGPLSALLGSIASLITCSIAIRAIYLAKQWHSDKFKAEIFESAQDSLNLVTSTPIDMLILRQNLRAKVQLLNLTHEQSDEIQKNTALIEANVEYCDKNHEASKKTATDTIRVLRYKKWIRKKYKPYTVLIVRSLAKINANLNHPLDLVNGIFVVNPDIEKLISEISDKKHSDIRNEIAEIKVTDFMSINEALKEIDEHIKSIGRE